MLSALGPQRLEVSLSLYSFNELSSEKAIRPSESMKFTSWPTFGEMCPWMNRGLAKFPSNYFVNEVAEFPRAAEFSENLR